MESKTVSFGFGSSTGLSFADLASSNSGDFAFGSKGKIGRRDFNDYVTESSTNERIGPLHSVVTKLDIASLIFTF